MRVVLYKVGAGVPVTAGFDVHCIAYRHISAGKIFMECILSPVDSYMKY